MPLVPPDFFDEHPELVAQALDFARQGASFEREFEHVRVDTCDSLRAALHRYIAERTDSLILLHGFRNLCKKAASMSMRSVLCTKCTRRLKAVSCWC